MPGTPSRAKRRVKRAEVAKPQRASAPLTADDEFEKSKAEARLQYFHGVEKELRETRGMLQAARAEVATVRKAMAELQEHYAKPWWQRFFDWLVT